VTDFFRCDLTLSPERFKPSRVQRLILAILALIVLLVGSAPRSVSAPEASCSSVRVSVGDTNPGEDSKGPSKAQVAVAPVERTTPVRPTSWKLNAGPADEIAARELAPRGTTSLQSESSSLGLTAASRTPLRC
jgi:hypothetical protein